MTAPASSAGPGARRSRTALDAIWSFFVSLKLTLWLCALLAVTSGLGTLLSPRPVSVVELRERVGGGVLFALARVLEFNDVFHSWWYTLFLWGLALNLVACTLERLPRVWAVSLRPERLLTDAALADRRYVARIPWAGDPQAAVTGVLAALARLGFKGRVEQDGELRHVFAERGRWARLGAHVTHVALLVILAGGILGRLGGSEGTVQVLETGGVFDAVPVRAPDGSTFPRPLGVAVQVVDFRLARGTAGSGRGESDLVVYEGGEPVARQTISVNHPMSWGRWSFYQAGHEQVPDLILARIDVIDRLDPERHDPHRLEVDRAVALPDGVQFGLIEYRPDQAGQGPAIHLAREDDGQVSDFWVFQDHPQFDLQTRPDRWHVEFKGLEPVYLTGVQAVHDPGSDIVFAGAVLLAFGLAQSFSSTHRRLWARVGPGEIVLAGSSHRTSLEFTQVFAQLERDLRA